MNDKVEKQQLVEIKPLQGETINEVANRLDTLREWGISAEVVYNGVRLNNTNMLSSEMMVQEYGFRQLINAQILMNEAQVVISKLMMNSGAVNFDLSGLTTYFDLLKSIMINRIVAATQQQGMDINSFQQLVQSQAGAKKPEVHASTPVSNTLTKPAVTGNRETVNEDKVEEVKEQPNETVNERYNTAQNEYYNLINSKRTLEAKGLENSDQYRELESKMVVAKKELDSMMEVRTANRASKSNYYADKSEEKIASETLEDRVSRISREQGSAEMYLKKLVEMDREGSETYTATQDRIERLADEKKLLENLGESPWKKTETPIQVKAENRVIEKAKEQTNIRDLKLLEDANNARKMVHENPVVSEQSDASKQQIVSEVSLSDDLLRQKAEQARENAFGKKQLDEFSIARANQAARDGVVGMQVAAGAAASALSADGAMRQDGPVSRMRAS